MDSMTILEDPRSEVSWWMLQELPHLKLILKEIRSRSDRASSPGRGGARHRSKRHRLVAPGPPTKS
jgi:hypothetical protein